MRFGGVTASDEDCDDHIIEPMHWMTSSSYIHRRTPSTGTKKHKSRARVYAHANTLEPLRQPPPFNCKRIDARKHTHKHTIRLVQDALRVTALQRVLTRKSATRCAPILMKQVIWYALAVRRKCVRLGNGKILALAAPSCCLHFASTRPQWPHTWLSDVTRVWHFYIRFYVSVNIWLFIRVTPSGDLICPGCQSKLGAFSWWEETCSCGAELLPSFRIHKSAVSYAWENSVRISCIYKAFCIYII